ncbi:uncharacterized protein [Dermacentor albipictus]|uniref:uncharacterized protein n=1 Tax=Dermacentor albipictus TaxID=60249 RepID=UPI0031FC9080
MNSPSAGAKSPKPKKDKRKGAKRKDRDRAAQDGMEPHLGAADCAPSPAGGIEMIGGPPTPAPEAPDPACYLLRQREPQSGSSKVPERWVTSTCVCPEMRAVCGISQDKPPCSTPAEEFPSLCASPSMETVTQQQCEQLGPDQLGGKEHTQLKEESLDPSSNIPGMSDATSGEKKTVHPREDVKPPKHHQKVKRSKHSKKAGRGTENRSSPTKETKYEAIAAANSRDQNPPEEKNPPAGTLEEGRGSNMQRRPKVTSSREQTKRAEAVVKGGATVSAAVDGPDQQQGAGTNPHDKLPAADHEATKSSVTEEPIYYDSFRTITNKQGDPLTEDIIGGFVSKADSTLLAFPTYLIEADKSPRSSSARVSRNCTMI